MNYRDYVIMPDVSALRPLFVDGQARGLRKRVFAKVGDSLSYWRHFLGSVGAGWAVYGDDNKSLRSTVRYFSRDIARRENSFSDPSLATIRGGVAYDQIRPYGENESAYLYYRHIVPAGAGVLPTYYELIKPAFSIIMIGTNDTTRQTDLVLFATQYQQILDETLSRSILPVLTTLPPLHNERHVTPYNDIISNYADSNQLPIIDLYSALLTIPNEGIIADNVHLTYPPDGNSADFTAGGLQYGYNVRNLLTLEALRQLRAALGKD